MEINKIICGDSLEVLKTLADESVDCVITSPPYFGLRDYGVSGQIGLEETPKAYVAKLVEVFREVRRVLRDDGILWCNLGDSYATAHKSGTTDATKGWKSKNAIGERQAHHGRANGGDLPGKNLIGIPWRVAFALQADGWYLRQDIIWAKPNPMPESVTDRCTKAHEYIFLLSKSPKYYFDNEAIKEDTLTQDTSDRNRDETRLNNTPGRTKMAGLKTNNYEKRNRRSVWTVTTKPFAEAHFATFPEALIQPMVLAGCPKEVCKKCGKARERMMEKTGRIVMEHGSKKMDIAVDRHEKRTSIKVQEYIQNGLTDCGCNAGFTGGIVLDPFMGAGTTAVVAKKLGRNYLGIELNPEYIKIAEKRINGVTTPIL